MPKQYDQNYKIEAVKLARELGVNKAAREIGIAATTLSGWKRAAESGRLDMGEGTHTPDGALSITEEITLLRKQIKEQSKEIRRLKEENEFLEEASAFFSASRLLSSLQKIANEIYCNEDRRRPYKRETNILLQNVRS